MITPRQIPGSQQAPQASQSKMDTLVVTPEAVSKWLKPDCQRELKKTPTFDKVVEFITLTETIPDVITLGRLKGDPNTYLVDGQHRVAAFLDSGLVEAIADVRICTYDSTEDMAAAFVRVNADIKRMLNDDNLRGMEFAGNVFLAKIRRECPWVGYDQARRSRSGGNLRTVLAMAAVIRCWMGSEGQTPTPGPSAPEAAKALTEESTESLVVFLTLLHEAFGKDEENARLYGGLTVSILMWLYRRSVLGEGLTTLSRTTRLTAQQFVAGLRELAADAGYAEWLIGRSLRDRDRAPAWRRIKAAFFRRLQATGVRSALFPSAEWQHGK